MVARWSLIIFKRHDGEYDSEIPTTANMINTGHDTQAGRLAIAVILDAIENARSNTCLCREFKKSSLKFLNNEDQSLDWWLDFWTWTARKSNKYYGKLFEIMR